jgi:hypothetical protein
MINDDINIEVLKFILTKSYNEIGVNIIRYEIYVDYYIRIRYKTTHHNSDMGRSIAVGRSITIAEYKKYERLFKIKKIKSDL